MEKAQEIYSRQAKFIDAYLFDRCAESSAKKAGYNAKRAYSIGSGLLKKHSI